MLFSMFISDVQKVIFMGIHDVTENHLVRIKSFFFLLMTTAGMLIMRLLGRVIRFVLSEGHIRKNRYI